MEYENLHKVQKYSHSMISGFTQTKSPAKPIQTLSSKWAPLSLWHSAIMRRVYLWCVFFLRFGNWTKFDINTSRKSIEKVITVQVLNFAVMCQCCWDWSKHPERERERIRVDKPTTNWLHHVQNSSHSHLQSHFAAALVYHLHRSQHLHLQHIRCAISLPLSLLADQTRNELFIGAANVVIVY